MIRTHLIAAGIISAFATTILTGCSGSAQPTVAGQGIVKGKLVNGGKPFALDPSKIPLPKGTTAPPGSSSNLLEIRFIPAGGGEDYGAETQPETGTFVVKGPGDKGIPPGRYKIAITARHGIGEEVPDYFKGRYTPENTQIIRDIKPSEEVVIDVSKPEG